MKEIDFIVITVDFACVAGTNGEGGGKAKIVRN